MPGTPSKRTAQELVGKRVRCVYGPIGIYGREGFVRRISLTYHTLVDVRWDDGTSGPFYGISASRFELIPDGPEVMTYRLVEDDDD